MSTFNRIGALEMAVLSGDNITVSVNDDALLLESDTDETAFLLLESDTDSTAYLQLETAS